MKKTHSFFHTAPAPHMAVAFVLSLSLLTGCALKREQEPRLEGDRIDVMVYKTPLTPTAEAKNAPLHLPKPITNANWAQVGGNAAHAPAHVALPATLKKAWSANIGGKKGYMLNPPVINGGLAFILTQSGDVLAINANTGAKAWQKSLTLREKDLSIFTGGITAQAGHLFVTTATGEVFALNAKTGDEVWKIDLAVPLRAAPTFYNGGLFVTSHDNRLFAINAKNGKLVWTHSGIEENLSILGGAAPAAAYGIIAAAYSGGDLYILRASDGQYLWHDSFAINNSGDPFSGLSDIVAPPVLADGIGYAVNVNGRLTAFHMQTGKRLWNVGLSATQMPWVAGAAVFAVTDNDELVALNRQDGAVRWVADLNTFTKKKRATRTWVGPILAGGRLIVASSDGHILSLDPKTGAINKDTTLNVSGVTVPPVVANGTLYVVTTSGKLVSFK